MILSPNITDEFYTEERCHILELLNDASIDPAISIAQARVEPGVTTALHTLDGIEIYYILSGKGKVEIDGISNEIGSGELCHIKKGQTQRIENIGSEDLLFLCICHPRFVPESYKSLE